MEKGNSSADSIPKFFRVYAPEVHEDDLELPMFLNRFFSKSFPENVTVRSRYGKRWRMGLRKCTEKFVLVNGWKKIARSENLISREFLFFEFDGSNVFSFCIYDRSMVKRLRSSRQTDEIEVESESDGEEERGSDVIIPISDDDDYVTTDNEEDDDAIQDESDSDKDKANDDIISSNDDIISSNDDIISSNDDYVATNNEEHADNYTANDNVDDHTINDDDYAANDNADHHTINDDDYSAHAANVANVANAANVANDDYAANDDADDDQDGNEGGKRRKVKDDRDYLDNRMNPFFTIYQKLKIRHGVRVPAKVIKDYNLKFHESIDIVDPLVKSFGKIKRKVVIEKNGSVYLKGFESIKRRNEVKSSDKMICELKTKKNGVVHEIKVHIVNV